MNIFQFQKVHKAGLISSCYHLIMSACTAQPLICTERGYMFCNPYTKPLEKEPDLRYPSVVELRRDLRRLKRSQSHHCSLR